MVWLPLIAGVVCFAALHRLGGARASARCSTSRLFRIRNFAVANLTTLTVYAGLDRRAPLRRPLPPAGGRLLAARGGPGDDADLAAALLPLAALRQARLRDRAAAADDARPDRRRARHAALHAARPGRVLRHRRAARGARLRPRALGDGGAADRDRARLGRRTPGRDRLRRQQRRLAGRRAARDRGARRGDLGPLRRAARLRARRRGRSAPGRGERRRRSEGTAARRPRRRRSRRGRGGRGSSPPPTDASTSAFHLGVAARRAS